MTQAGFNLRNLMRRAVGKSMSKQVQPSPDQTKNNLFAYLHNTDTKNEEKSIWRSDGFC